MQRPRWLLTGVGALCFVLPTLVTAAWADSINFNSRLAYTTSDTQTTLKRTNEGIRTQSDNFDQRYNLDFSKTLFPYLSFAGGSFYELNDITSSTLDLQTSFKQERLSPFLEMNLNNPYYNAGVSYRKTRVEEQGTGLEKAISDRDLYTVTMGMKPMGLVPQWNMTYTRTVNASDPTIVDLQEDLLNFSTQYTPVADLNLNYAYTLIDTDNRLRNFTTTEQTHFGRIAYSHNFLQNRLAMSTGYSVNYNTLTLPGTTTVERPLLRAAGLSSLDATPTDGPALVSTPALIDGNLTASAGLDIGLGGDEFTLTNIGLDFGFSDQVNVLRIWVDRRLTGPVANSFAWSVYTSPDNLDTSTWTLIATVAPASFGVFENRFELSFPAVSTRFIKVVTRPLLPTVPGAATFPNIFITEMEALSSETGVPVTNVSTTVNHNYNLNLSGRLGRKTTLGYNLYYTLRTEAPSDLNRDQVTNGFNLNHSFDTTFSGNASFQRTDESDVNQKRNDNVYSIALRAAWLETLNQILTYSLRTTNDAAGDLSQNAVVLRTNALLYHGWDAFMDLGYYWDEDVDGSKTTTRLLKGGTNIVPIDTLTFNLNYTYKEVDSPDSPAATLIETQTDLQGFYVPFPDLSLFARISIVDKRAITDVLKNYSINWAPFAQGDLQLSLNYSELLRADSDQTEKVFGPSARWTIGRYITLDLTYTRGTTENALLKTDTESVTAAFKINL